MRLLIDNEAAKRFDFIRPEIVRGEVRSYYVTSRDDAVLALLVILNGRCLLADVAGRVVDASLGWDDGYPGYVHITSRRHSKIAVRAVLVGDDHEDTLSNVLARAPRRETKSASG